MKKLPKKLDILGQKWTVVRPPNMPEDLYGQVLREKHEIQISPKCHPEATGESFLHELLHAVFQVAGNEFENDDAEERFIQRYSPILYAVFTRNKLRFDEN